MTTAPRPVSWGWLLLLIGSWATTWLHLSIEWNLNSAYQYGFGVPLLFLVLAARRWPGVMTPPPERTPRVIVGVLAGAWLILLVGEILRGLDPVWRLPGGLLLLGCVLLTAAFFWHIGGPPLLRRELFPLAFSGLALPWPSQLEQAVSAFLQQSVTSTSIAFAEIVGIAAVRRGSIIELRHAVVGLQEACSGIESLQATLFVTLFLGELYRLTPLRRIGLWLGGSVLCLATNFARISFLLLIGNANGQARLDQLHDTSGVIASGLNFLLIYLLSLWLRPNPSNASAEIPFTTPRLAFSLRSLGLVATFSAIPLLSALWIHHLEAPPAPGSQTLSAHPLWKLNLQRLPKDWQAVSVPEPKGVRALLRHTQWEAYDLLSPSGEKLRLVHLYWTPGRITARNRFVHTPDVCMPNAGWTLVSQAEPLRLNVAGTETDFTCQYFTQEPFGSVSVLQGFSSGAPEKFQPDEIVSPERWDRLELLWRASRLQSREELLLYVADTSTSRVSAIAQAVLTLVEPARPNSSNR